MSDIEEVNLDQGQSLALTFREASSAGYIWEVTHADEGLLIEDGYQAPETDVKPSQQAFGGTNSREFTVTPLQAGTFEMELQHRRPWTSEAGQARKFRLIVK